MHLCTTGPWRHLRPLLVAVASGGVPWPKPMSDPPACIQKEQKSGRTHRSRCVLELRLSVCFTYWRWWGSWAWNGSRCYEKLQWTKGQLEASILSKTPICRSGSPTLLQPWPLSCNMTSLERITLYAALSATLQLHWSTLPRVMGCVLIHMESQACALALWPWSHLP